MFFTQGILTGHHQIRDLSLPDQEIPGVQDVSKQVLSPGGWGRSVREAPSVHENWGLRYVNRTGGMTPAARLGLTLFFLVCFMGGCLAEHF